MVSVKFDGTDLAAYGLEIQALDLPFIREYQSVQLPDKEVGSRGTRPGKQIRISCNVYAVDMAALLTNLDMIYRVLSIEGEKPLILGHLPGRYWQAEFVSMTGTFTGVGAYATELTFFAPDPLAFDVTETMLVYSLTTDPKVISITGGGSAPTFPVWAFTTDTSLPEQEFTVTNLTTNETIRYTQTFPDTETIKIDSEKYIVYRSDIPDMLHVEGMFPRLLPGNNDIVISNFGTAASLEVRYRKRFI